MSSSTQQPHVCRVLIVDDEERVRAALGRLLEVDGHRPLFAPNGVAALETVRREWPCLVLLDLRMPVLDGPGFIAGIELDPALRALPIVIVSANPEDAPAARPILRKPFTFEQLRHVLRRHRCCDVREASRPA